MRYEEGAGAAEEKGRVRKCSSGKGRTRERKINVRKNVCGSFKMCEKDV